MLRNEQPEIVIRVSRDAPPDKIDWTIEEASDMVGEFCIGAEILSSAAYPVELRPGRRSI